MRLSSFLVPLALVLGTPGYAFLNTPQHISPSRRTFVSQRQVLFDDFEGFSMNDDEFQKKQESASSASSADFYASLRARQSNLQSEALGMDYTTSVLEGEEQYFRDNWRTAQCSSTVRLTLDDWIRRIAIDNYPLAVCGTAGGHLYLADLQEGDELDCLLNVHVSCNEDLPEEPTVELLEALDTLYGQYDGGGVMALAMKDDWIVSSGREGGVHVSRIVGQEEQVYRGSRGGTSRQTKLSLQRVGRFRGLKSGEGNSDTIITSLAFDSMGSLWMGGFDGILRSFDYDERKSQDKPSMISRTKPLTQVDVGAPIVSLFIEDELGCGVASTTDGVVIFSLEDSEIVGKWNPLVKKVRKEFVRSAILLKDDSHPDQAQPPTWSVVCGGSKGSLLQRKLNVDKTGVISESRPFLDQIGQDESAFPVKMRPSHGGAVVALSSPSPGLLVSGSLDGSMRVWDYAEHGDEEDFEDADDDDDEAEIDLDVHDDAVQSNDLRPQCLYALSGYKVWLGSVFTSSRKLVSDGSDNTIIVHSFENEEEVLFSDDDDEDEMEGFNFE
jgi:WD40 repeat protein